MSKYKSLLQETFRTYDNPLDEETSKLILSYLKFYNYNPEVGVIRYKDRTYKVYFKSNDKSAELHFGLDTAVLTEFEGFTTAAPISKIDFIKKEKLEYLGDFNTKCIVYTFNKFSESIYFGPNNYMGMKKEDYLNNKIPKNTIPEDYKNHSEYPTYMMRLIASADYANEIRASRFNPPAYYGRQF